MLNPSLYRSLERVTRQPVRVVHEDEEAVCTKVKKNTPNGVELVLEIVSPGEQYMCCCPYCGDEHYHLSVNYLYGSSQVNNSTSLAHCFHNCLENKDNREDLRNRLLGFTNRTDSIKPLKVSSVAEVKTDFVHLTDITPIRELPENHRAIQYLVETRKFTLDMLEPYNLGYCSHSSQLRYASDKIIIPIYMDGEERGWQARCVGAPPVGRPKYYTAPGMHKREVLYNYDVAKTQDYIVLTEGVMDAWRVGPAGVCSFGKSLSNAQAKLLQKANKPVIVMYDNDLTAREEKIVLNRLLAVDLSPKRIAIPDGYKDPDSMPTELIHTLIKEKLNG